MQAYLIGIEADKTRKWEIVYDRMFVEHGSFLSRMCWYMLIGMTVKMGCRCRTMESYDREEPMWNFSDEIVEYWDRIPT